MEHVMGVAAEHVLRISAKTGLHVEEVLEHVVRDVPPPGGDPDAPLRALIFDSKFDQYRDRSADRGCAGSAHAARRTAAGSIFGRAVGRFASRAWT